jgi:DNA-directed RNA polymerase specialized sigma24 family protein
MSSEITPLTLDQQKMVESHLGLAGEVARLAVKRLQRFDIADELRHELQCHLCQVALKYDRDHHGDGEESGFAGYAWKCLQGAAKRFFEKEKHLKGLNYGNKGGIQVSALSELSEPFYDNPTSLWELQEEILDMLSVISPIEQDAILLTGYMDYTTMEAAEIIDKSWQSLERIKSAALKKIQAIYEYRDGDIHRTSDEDPPPLHTRRSHYTVASRPILPKHFIGSEQSWKNLIAAGYPVPCPHCVGLKLKAHDYCIYCDRWGQDTTTARVRQTA